MGKFIIYKVLKGEAFPFEYPKVSDDCKQGLAYFAFKYEENTARMQHKNQPKNEKIIFK